MRTGPPPLPNIAEIKHFVNYQMKVQPDVPLVDMMEKGGFIIKHLQGSFVPHPGCHSLFWNKGLKQGICQCEQWVGGKGWGLKKTLKQHTMHMRLKDALKPQGVSNQTKEDDTEDS